MGIAEILIKAREEAGLKQAELARDVGCRQSNISYLEDRSRTIVASKWYAPIAKRLSLSLSALIDGRMEYARHQERAQAVELVNVFDVRASNLLTLSTLYDADTEFAQAAGIDISALQLLKTRIKPIDTMLAKKISANLGKSAGWLDIDRRRLSMTDEELSLLMTYRAMDEQAKRFIRASMRAAAKPQVTKVDRSREKRHL